MNGCSLYPGSKPGTEKGPWENEGNVNEVWTLVNKGMHDYL